MYIYKKYIYFLVLLGQMLPPCAAVTKANNVLICYYLWNLSTGLEYKGKNFHWMLGSVGK